MSRAVAIFGGTFNPIHLGHLRAAEEVREAAGLDEVRFVPAALPPHKDPESVGLAPAHHRLRMVEVALENVPGFRAWPVEIERGGTSYSIDTIRALRTEVPADPRVAFMLGWDAFADVHTWKDFEEIFGLCDVLVFTRPPDVRPPDEHALPVAARQAFRYDPEIGAFRHRSGHRLTMHQVTSFAISATDVRRRLASGRSIGFLVPDAVETYIRQHGLFGTRPSDS
jgi:nicotinate-nucleotide adenylyltransferase